jgi:pre-mRNA-splicing factor ATP-dependent RNA helicase DHX16
MGKSSKKTALEHWCEDHLHDLLGFADTALASYLVHVAIKAKSARDIQDVLKEGNVMAAEAKQRDFCEALYQKARGGATRKSDSSKRKGSAATNAEWMDKAKSYSMLPDEDDQGNVAEPEKKKKGRKKSSERGDPDEVADKGRSSKLDRLKEKKKRLRKGRDDESDGSSSSAKGRRRHRSHIKEESIQERRERRKDRKRQRLDGGDSDASGQEEVMVKESDTLNPEQRAELERERDLRERDEFVQRILDRDKKKTRKVGAEASDEEEEQEESKEAARKRIDLEERLARGETIRDEEGREINLERLRTESRRAYLKKRQEREVTLLKQSLEDEEELFRNQNLSAAERKRIELGKQIIKMVEKNENTEDQDDGFYRLPDEYDEKASKVNQDQALLKSRYVESKHEKSEQELWEESQTRKAEILHKKKRKGESEKEYDLVFDDQIDFVMQETTKGYDRRDKKHRTSSAKMIKIEEEVKPVTEHEKILAGRKKLPVFPYREEFLSAVKDHQILVLVGETGSGKTTQVSFIIFSFFR